MAKKWPEMIVKRPFMNHKFSVFFLQNCKKLEAKNVFYVIAFDPINILKNWALQNDRQNLSFVKPFYCSWQENDQNWS